MTLFNVPLLASAALMSPPALRFNGVAFSEQGKALLGPCSFNLEGTGPTLVMGPNGAGKTTTFYMIAGVLRPDRGRILLDARGLTRLAMRRRAQANNVQFF